MIEVVTSYASETADETCLNGRGVSLDIDDHIHCCNCFRVVCSYDRCTTIKCSVCYITLHACKLEDHLLLCPKLRVPCPNASFGCPLNIRRDKICVHLEHCPASIVLCNLQWNRRVLSKYAKRKLKRYARGLDKVESTSAVDETEIDVWSAIHDQEVLMESYRTRRSERKRLCDYHNPLHPLLPLRLPFETIDTFDDLDSSDEENRLKVEAANFVFI
ncbi:hypothetical protein AB6A40_011111 [Gnathostoma spinigerum]|uniref:TRAF-type domain-containing protein n=1 Tax=Gnathostoma spinigerum TaxID=75299 RepID=A0ABD6EZ65_9BILA